MRLLVGIHLEVSLLLTQACLGLAFLFTEGKKSCRVVASPTRRQLCLLTSCQGRCGQSANHSYPCQCNSLCERYNDCCNDYTTQCLSSCVGSCNSHYDRSRPCQCNSECSRYNNCCHDYASVCSSSGVTTSCQSLSQVAQAMWDNDVNRLSPSDITLNYQQQVPDASVDKSSQKLITFLNTAKLSGPTYSKFIALLDNYQPVKGSAESDTPSETQEVSDFLDAVLNTSVMQFLESFLICQHKITNRTDLKAKLKQMWFDFYARSGSSSVGDTSGFEHVMVGEYKSSSVVNGFHNWISFYEREQSGDLNYYGYVRLSTVEQEFALVGAAFNWEGRKKDLGAFFVGVSPEFDMGIYSLCFFMNPGRGCHFDINSKSFMIQSYRKDDHIATAYASASWTDPSGPVVG